MSEQFASRAQLVLALAVVLVSCALAVAALATVLFWLVRAI